LLAVLFNPRIAQRRRPRRLVSLINPKLLLSVKNTGFPIIPTVVCEYHLEKVEVRIWEQMAKLQKLFEVSWSLWDCDDEVFLVR
jgi:hypothetical protein